MRDSWFSEPARRCNETWWDSDAVAWINAAAIDSNGPPPGGLSTYGSKRMGPSEGPISVSSAQNFLRRAVISDANLSFLVAYRVLPIGYTLTRIPSEVRGL